MNDKFYVYFRTKVAVKKLISNFTNYITVACRGGRPVIPG